MLTSRSIGCQMLLLNIALRARTFAAFIFHILNFHLEFFSLFHDKLHEAQKKFLAMQKISSRAWRAANLKEKFFSASYAWVLPGNTNNKQIQYKMSKCESCMHYISIICTLTLELSDMTFDELLGADLRPSKLTDLSSFFFSRKLSAFLKCTKVKSRKKDRLSPQS